MKYLDLSELYSLEERFTKVTLDENNKTRVIISETVAILKQLVISYIGQDTQTIVNYETIKNTLKHFNILKEI